MKKENVRKMGGVQLLNVQGVKYSSDRDVFKEIIAAKKRTTSRGDCYYRCFFTTGGRVL